MELIRHLGDDGMRKRKRLRRLGSEARFVIVIVIMEDLCSECHYV